MRAQLGRLTTAFFSTAIKWRDPLVLISVEILTDGMNGWFPAELRHRHIRSPVFHSSEEEEDLRGDENIRKTGSVTLKGWCRPERRSHVIFFFLKGSRHEHGR